MARKAPKGQLPPPQCKAILLCERAIFDGRTGMYSLINIFDFVYVSDPYCTIGPYQLFLQLTGGLGPYQITVEILDLQADVVLVREDHLEITFGDKNEKWNGDLEVGPFEITHAGSYDVLVLADGQEIDRQKLTVVHQVEDFHGEDEGADES